MGKSHGRYRGPGRRRTGRTGEGCEDYWYAGEARPKRRLSGESERLNCSSELLGLHRQG
jgi:hypothetical protein